MAMQLMDTPAIEQYLREFAATLTEKDCRRFTVAGERES